MKTPIADFVKSYQGSDSVRLHMPGHKGKTFLGMEKSDITEIEGADVLYSPEGIIKESELNASLLFGTRHTFYSTEGSSLRFTPLDKFKNAIVRVFRINTQCERKQ